MMTKQEIFDRVATHLLTQNQRASVERDDGAEVCRYRAGDLKCAVGCLIKDEHYDPRVEGNGVSSSYVADALKASGITGAHGAELRMFLSDLQDCHDVFAPKWWRGRLVELAERYNLSAAVCQ